jgi:hypothetical protein
MPEITEVREIVIATSHSGFALSPEACSALAGALHRGPFEDISRDDPVLVATVKRLGDLAGAIEPLTGQRVPLAIVEVPADVEYVIEEYDGAEWVSEAHRRWDILGEMEPGTGSLVTDATTQRILDGQSVARGIADQTAARIEGDGQLVTQAHRSHLYREALAEWLKATHSGGETS